MRLALLPQSLLRPRRSHPGAATVAGITMAAVETVGLGVSEGSDLDLRSGARGIMRRRRFTIHRPATTPRRPPTIHGAANAPRQVNDVKQMREQMSVTPDAEDRGQPRNSRGGEA